MQNFNEPDYQRFPYHTYESFKQKLFVEGRKLSGRIAFWYINSDYQTSARVVDPVAYLENYLLAFCYLRNELRVFNMQEAWDVRVASSGAVYDSLNDWITNEPRSGPATLPEPTPDEIENLTRLPLLPTAERAFMMGAELSQELTLRSNGRWHVKQTICDASHSFYINVNGKKKDGSITRTAHSTAWFKECDVTYFNETVELISRHRPRPWELRKGTKLVIRTSSIEELKKIWISLLKIEGS